MSRLGSVIAYGLSADGTYRPLFASDVPPPVPAPEDVFSDEVFVSGLTGISLDSVNPIQAIITDIPAGSKIIVRDVFFTLSGVYSLPESITAFSNTLMRVGSRNSSLVPTMFLGGAVTVPVVGGFALSFNSVRYGINQVIDAFNEASYLTSVWVGSGAIVNPPGTKMYVVYTYSFVQS